MPLADGLLPERQGRGIELKCLGQGCRRQFRVAAAAGVAGG